MAPSATSSAPNSSPLPSIIKKAFDSTVTPPSPFQDTWTTSTSNDDNIIAPLRKALTTESTPLAIRFRALFSLKHHAAEQPSTEHTIPAIQAIAAALPSPSALLKHELAYCLGQSKNLAAVPYLQAVVRDKEEDAMCRHEAAEALGAIGDRGSVELLERFWKDDEEETVVRETCEIALGRILWAHSDAGKGGEKIRSSDFASVDPAPPEAEGQRKFTIEELKRRLLDTRLGLFDRYRAMFALRDLASPPDLPTAVPAIDALAAGFEDGSALFRHEIAFVFGQLSHPASIPALKKTLAKLDEESMVRHEAAEALGSLGDEDGVEDFLRRYLNDEEQVVRDSVIVALDMAEFERNGEMEYAVLPSDGNGFSPFVQSK